MAQEQTPQQTGLRAGDPQARTGTCLRWRDVYGFVAPDGGGPELFVHFSAIGGMDGFKELRPGDRVEYEVGDHNGRPAITWCRVVG